MAKGAGMIHPNMATLLAFVTTNAWMNPGSLKRALTEAARESFNRISVDGETSTNDMVLLLANGRSGRSLSSGRAYRAFVDLLSSVCQSLAEQVVSDGEGATKRVIVRVEGARTESEAAKVAVAIVRSPLVKTALFGEDPNWGRILAAAGASGVDLTLPRISLYVEDTRLLIRGIAQGKDAEEAAAKHLKARAFKITLNLGRGKAVVAYQTCDLSLDYVRINADYRS
jgi:glutamate N-acetyltransferase/amino-acid N-acetyltransferase